MNIHVYQSPVTGHWLVDKYGTRDRPSTWRQGWRSKVDALAGAWGLVAERPGRFDGVVVAQP